MTFNKEVMFSSKTPEWATPQWLFDRLHKQFNFTLDPASNGNAKVQTHFTKEQDGLKEPWAPNKVFLNPPYGRVLGQWVEKAWKEAQLGATVVLLIPSRTDTKFWHDHIMRSSKVYFFKGRLHFNNHPTGAPFPSALVIMLPKCNGPPIFGSIPSKEK